MMGKILKVVAVLAAIVAALGAFDVVFSFFKSNTRRYATDTSYDDLGC